MKLLCCSKFLLLFFLFGTLLFASTPKKSAIVYYGSHISYPMVGIHDYIIVEPNNIDVYQHGFAVYKNKMYAYVSIGEIDPDDPAFAKLDKNLIVGKNKAWKSHLLDLTNPAYKEFLFKEMIEPQIKRGFVNFFFDTLDSYELIAKTKEDRAKNKAALIDIIHTFHQRYPHAKLILNRGFEILDKVHTDITALLFESYYQGVGGKNLSYRAVSQEDREWLDGYLKKAKTYKLDIICVDYLPLDKLAINAPKLISKLEKKDFIPYVATRELDSYGYTSKNAIKREILTLIDEHKEDRVSQSAHLLGALPLEYQGYIQKLYNIDEKPLPSMAAMQQYAGVIIWLSGKYKNPAKLIEWIVNLQKYNIKVVFMNDFFVDNPKLLEKLAIHFKNIEEKPDTQYKIVTQNKMIGFEIDPPHNTIPYYLDITEGQALLTLKNSSKKKSTLAAIMPWGGFAVGQSATVTIAQDNLWVIDPFTFFKKALRLQNIPIPDTTTQNGKRLLFSHIDGDGIMNRVEWNPKLFSGDTIYSDILTQYDTPISVSVIGAEINKNGLYPKLAPALQKIVKEIYALKNVEPATHTFTHPFFWGKIKNGDLDPQYRLKPKGYKFSLDYEIRGMLEEINTKFLPKNKYPKAKTVFWSGDCVPTENILHYVYKNKILNINGGDTTITNLHPWLSYIAPMGLERGGYYQVYTGQQNENIYTNEWLGPFWGFKKVVQTFKLTDKPRRLKPIDIYYHLYSGSKRASLNALKYVYNWSLKQDVNPIFTSEYIPKVMDYYTVSIAALPKEIFYINGMKNIKTLRIDSLDYNSVKLNDNIAGFKKVGNENYLHLGTADAAIISNAAAKQKEAYLISANAKITKLQRQKNVLDLTLTAHVPLKFELFVPHNCILRLSPDSMQIQKEKEYVYIQSLTKKRATVHVQCRE
jgi:hypothetical protein